MKAFVVDDEPLAREELIELLKQHSDIEVVGSYGNALECLKALSTHKPDVIFLDIEMPQITGLELANMLEGEHAPEIIFVTAYDEFALAAFERNAVDYLLKPVVPERLKKSLVRLQARQPEPTPNSYQSMLQDEPLKLIPCYFNNRVKLLRQQDIEYAYSDLSGVHVVTAEGTNHTQITLKALEDKTPLLRCHRQYLVNVEAIKEIAIEDNGGAILFTHHGAQLPVSRRYFKSIKQHFGL
ncbi:MULTISPECIES: two-component system response regulator BtsR [Aliagarivorans]|uniref:two-component system response regulator BtsR n=1 Tax=Aliagarivorans TaxID=882379 RepID=UPI00041AD83F|nr:MULTISPECIES: two-component system response regulator BtsR [Aliagarivorans]